MRINSLSVCMALAVICSVVMAQASGAEPQNISVWSTIASGGIIGYAIICMSLCVVALVIEHFLSIRSIVLLPQEHQENLAELIEKKQVSEAVEYCQENPSFFTNVVGSGLRLAAGGANWTDVEKMVEDSARRQAGKLYRKLEYLSFIAASAPMLGLLGTVTGMMSAFSSIAIIDGAARSSQLAGAISEALVTTCLGLIVAIPTLFFISVLRNRIESILTDAEEITEELLRPLKLQS
jgi:biopolymer transport protein ExbB